MRSVLVVLCVLVAVASAVRSPSAYLSPSLDLSLCPKEIPIVPNVFIPPSFFSANLTDNTLTTNLTGTVSTFDIDTEEGITYSFSAVTSWTYTTNPQTITYSTFDGSLFANGNLIYFDEAITMDGPSGAVTDQLVSGPAGTDPKIWEYKYVLDCSDTWTDGGTSTVDGCPVPITIQAIQCTGGRRAVSGEFAIRVSACQGQLFDYAIEYAEPSDFFWKAQFTAGPVNTN